jgi:hypothetical protein
MIHTPVFFIDEFESAGQQLSPLNNSDYVHLTNYFFLKQNPLSTTVIIYLFIA